MIQDKWRRAFSQLPLIAILRGVTDAEAIELVSVLIDKGFRCIEVPLNSPDALKTIELLAKEFDGDIVIGAGTVLSAESVAATVDAGGTLIVAPNLDLQVAQAVSEHDCVYCPGVATPSEAFSAINLGAAALKLFPAEMMGPSVVKALRAVLPPETLLLPVGGITPDTMSDYFKAGANGFGLGSGLYKPGKSLGDISNDAGDYVAACEGH